MLNSIFKDGTIDEMALKAKEHRITKMAYRDRDTTLEVEFELPPSPAETQAYNNMVETLKKQNNISDDDILLNPYHGMD